MTQWRESPGGERQFLGGDGYWYPEGARVASQVQPLGQAPPTIYRKNAVPAANSEAKGASIMAIIGGGALTYYGWVCSWNTTTVPNGSYTLVSEASGSGGSAFSPGVSITVHN
jgi:hypothetical protein